MGEERSAPERSLHAVSGGAREGPDRAAGGAREISIVAGANCDSAAACITGQVYVIDGGTLAKRPRRSMSDWEHYLAEHAS